MLRGKMPFSSHLVQSTRGWQVRWCWPQSPGWGFSSGRALFPFPHRPLWKAKPCTAHTKPGVTLPSSGRLATEMIYVHSAWRLAYRLILTLFLVYTLTQSLVCIIAAPSTPVLWVITQHHFMAQTALALSVALLSCRLWPLTNHHFCFVGARSCCLALQDTQADCIHSLFQPRVMWLCD